MPNPHGTPIWYELVTRNADAAASFYETVIGWSVGPRPEGDMDYRMIGTADGSDVGGLVELAASDDAVDDAGWRFYIGVDDVDATAATITSAGGSVAIPPFDFPGVGRMAFVADPQGIPFFIMRGASDDDSTAWDRTGMGKCNWNELATPDQASASAFYAEAFGWTYPDRMTMPGEMGDYVFVEAAGARIGATMTAMKDGPPPKWQFYFRAPDIEDAAAKVAANGGTVVMGPHEVPGGDRIIVATDPEGTIFGVVGPGDGAQAGAAS